MQQKDELQLLQVALEKYSFIDQNHWKKFVRSRLCVISGMNNVYWSKALGRIFVTFSLTITFEYRKQDNCNNINNLRTNTTIESREKVMSILRRKWWELIYILTIIKFIKGYVNLIKILECRRRVQKKSTTRVNK